MRDVRVILRNPLDWNDRISYRILPEQTQVANDWLDALEKLLQSNRRLNKEYCFVGFPDTPRNLRYLCGVLNRAVHAINTHDWQQHGLSPYVIEDWYAPDVVRYGPEYAQPDQLFPDMLFHSTKHSVMNRLHNYFEQLQGTVEDPSAYFLAAPPHIRIAIGQLNTTCHEIENLVLSQRKAATIPEWVRPSQITNWDGAERYTIGDHHKLACQVNGFDRKFGYVYMHWAQIGKTLYEVFRDEHAPKLDATTCEAITQLKYYSGEFDVEWGKDVVMGSFHWHDEEMSNMEQWLLSNGLDPHDRELMLGYIPLGRIDLIDAFGTEDPQRVWPMLSRYLDIHRIEVGDVGCTYDYSWSDDLV